MAENNSGNRAYLSDVQDEDGLYPIWGVAIGNNDVTIGQKSGEPKLWRPSVLEEAAETLEDKDIVVNHENRDAYELIGQITEAKYDDGKGVIYRGHIDSDELARKIEHGWLEVSPRIIHSKAHDMVQDVKVPEFIQEFDNLSIVRKGAAHSNEVNLGEAEELTVAELQESFEEDEDDSVSDYEMTAQIEELQGEISYAKYMYDSPNAAEGASQKWGCGGYHEHTIQGESWYMPCQTHDDFLENLKEKKAEENSSDETTLSVGDEVETPKGKGTIEELADSGAYEGSVENGRVKAKDDDPAVLVTLDGEDETVGYNLSELSAWEEIEEVESEDEDSDDEEVVEEEELREGYSKEEARMASQMASHSALTKDECFALVDVLNPTKGTDIVKMAELVKKVMEEDEVERFMEALKRGGEEEGNEKPDAREDSILNRIL